MSIQNRLLKAVEEAHYDGERTLWEDGEIKAAIVPVEDLETLKEMELSECELICK